MRIATILFLFFLRILKCKVEQPGSVRFYDCEFASTQRREESQMAKYVVAGGSRKNPAIEKINSSRRQTAEQPKMILSGMKAIAVDADSPRRSVTTGDHTNAHLARRAGVPSIPLRFLRGRE